MKNLFLILLFLLIIGKSYSQEGYWKVTGTSLANAQGVVEYQHWKSDGTIICLNYGAGNRVTLSYNAWLTSPYLPGKVFVGPSQWNLFFNQNTMKLVAEYGYIAISYVRISDEEAGAFEKDLATVLSSNNSMQPTPSAKAMQSPDYIRLQIQYYQNKIDDVDRRINHTENQSYKSAMTYALINQLKSERQTYEKYKAEWEEKLYR